MEDEVIRKLVLGHWTHVEVVVQRMFRGFSKTSKLDDYEDDIDTKKSNVLVNTLNIESVDLIPRKRYQRHLLTQDRYVEYSNHSFSPYGYLTLLPMRKKNDKTYNAVHYNFACQIQSKSSIFELNEIELESSLTINPGEDETMEQPLPSNGSEENGTT